MNAPVRVDDNGQVTLPQDVLDQLGIGPGSEITFRRTADGKFAIERAGASLQPAQPLDPDRFRKLRGHAGPGLTTDEIMEMTRGD